MLASIVFFLAEVEPSWFYWVILYLLAQLIGRFFYTLIAGINISKIIIVDNGNPETVFFESSFQLGLSKIQFIEGEYDKQIDISPEDLGLIIYNSGKRQEFEELLLLGNKTISFYNKKQKFDVSFKCY